MTALASITSNFNITWTEAHQLTLGEVRDLLIILEESEVHRRG